MSSGKITSGGKTTAGSISSGGSGTSYGGKTVGVSRRYRKPTRWFQLRVGRDAPVDLDDAAKAAWAIGYNDAVSQFINELRDNLNKEAGRSGSM